MNILLTGAGGFLGSHIIKELKKEHFLTALVHKTPIKDPDITMIKGDITNPQSLNIPNDIDVLVHSAALATDHASTSELNFINQQGTYNIFKACKDMNITNYVYVSSAGIYGFPNSEIPITEESPKRPYTPYQKSKFLGELEIDKFQDLSITCIRPPLIIGPSGAPIHTIITQLQSGSMPYVGSGDNRLPVVHPQDVSRLIRLAIDHGTPRRAFNVASLHTSPKELFSNICQAFDLQEPSRHIPYYLAYILAFLTETFRKDPRLTRFRIKSLGTNRVLSYQRAIDELGFSPKYAAITSLINDISINYQD